MKNSLIYILVTTIVFSGCYKRVEIPREQLSNDSRFSSELKTADSSPKKVTYVVSEKNKYNTIEFTSFHVQNNNLVGEVKGVNGIELRTIPLDNIQSIQRKEFSATKTTFGIIGFIAALVVLLLGGVVISCAASHCGPD